MLQSLELTNIRLLPGPLENRQNLCGEYLLSLDPSRLLHNFRINAGLPSSARPLGGWESPQCGLRGHFTGHYLSACSKMFASTGDQKFADRAKSIIQALAECQQALGAGYLSAFPISQFDALERDCGKTSPIWAPYYTLHKILAGLIDAHIYVHDSQSLSVAIQLADWIAARLKSLSPETLEAMLRTDSINPSNEFGGIGETLYELHQLTGSASYLESAKLFDRSWFFSPLIDGRDALAGLHANTHIPQILAAARRFQITGEETYRLAAEYFWERTALARSYANGGSSGPRPDRRERSEGGEHWPIALQLHGTLTPKINESCVANNMLRLTDAVFTWNQDPKYADFRERAFLNSVLAMQHPRSMGSFIYSHPLSSGSRKIYGDPDETFWCCYGTTVEAYASLAAGAYFCNQGEFWVSQFIASEASWPQRSVKIVQQTDFPQTPATKLIIRTQTETDFTLHIRIPAWATSASWRLNAGESQHASPGFLKIHRPWRDGDTVELDFPMSLRTEPLPGDNSLIAFFYGPVLLAARTHHALDLGVSADKAITAVRKTDPHKLRFAARLGFGGEVPLVPVYEITDEPFGVYFKTS